jgi:beta-mannosidase
MVSARLLVDGQVVARATAWPQPFKYYELLDPGLALNWVNSTTLRLSVTRPVKGVWLTAPQKDGVTWSDNMLDLVPNDPQLITVLGLSESDTLEVNWLGKAISVKASMGLFNLQLTKNGVVSTDEQVRKAARP